MDGVDQRHTYDTYPYPADGKVPSSARLILTPVKSSMFNFRYRTGFVWSTGLQAGMRIGKERVKPDSGSKKTF